MTPKPEPRKRGEVDETALIAELDSMIGAGFETPVVTVDPSPELLDVSDPDPNPGPSANFEAEPTPLPSRNNGRRRILVAEDNNDYRQTISYVLRKNGFEVIEAKDGGEAVQRTIAENPDLVMVDFDMPELNGYEVIQEIRKRDDTRKTPILMLTGASNRKQLREVGMDISVFLEKPITNAKLLSALRDVLGNDFPVVEEEPEEESPVPIPVPESETESSSDFDMEPSVPVQEPEEEATSARESLEALEDERMAADLLLEERTEESEDEPVGLDVLANESPLVNRVNRILVRAVDLGASDIHIEPQEKNIVVRARLHGDLQPLCMLPLGLSARLAARIKIMASLIITERRRPQDGQFRARINGEKIEFRVSTIPALHGEKIVLRILGQGKIRSELDQVGMPPRDLEALKLALNTPHGLILMTGPTGSGKTTTLYSMVAHINRPEVNIMTAEDPVEYEVAGITQVPVKPQIGLNFESVLRSFLRQDPDIMLVGEIRDLETAEIAVKASITGHLVLSTLHTNSAPSSVTRLINMGVPPYLVAASVRLIVAQRLLKVLCSNCKKKGKLADEDRRVLTEEESALIDTVYFPNGCKQCHNTGFKGRMAVFEVMPIRTPEMRQMILKAENMDKITEQAVKEGMRSLRAATLDIVARGDAPISEAMTVILTE